MTEYFYFEDFFSLNSVKILFVNTSVQFIILDSRVWFLIMDTSVRFFYFVLFGHWSFRTQSVESLRTLLGRFQSNKLSFPC